MFTYWYSVVVCDYTTDYIINRVCSSRLFKIFNFYIFIRISYVVCSSDEYVSTQFFTVNTVVFVSLISNLHSGIYNATICKNITELQIFYRDYVTI